MDEWLVRHVDDESEDPRVGTVMALRGLPGDPEYADVHWWGGARRTHYYEDLVTIQEGLLGDSS